jgi:uncharacterized protein (DUF3820 family)
MKKYLEIAIANESRGTIGIERKDRIGNIVVKEYAEVNQRIKAFRMVYPTGSIETEMLSNENGVCIFKATIKDENRLIIGTGTACEKENSSFINQTSYIENCETSAVGRALGMCGFGIDVSVASAEEVQNAINNQTVTQEDADNYVLTFGKYKGKKLKEVPKDYVEWLLGNRQDERMQKIIELATGITIPTEEEQDERINYMSQIQELAIEKDIDLEEVKDKFKVDSLTDMTTEQMKKCILAMQKKEVEHE